MPETTIPNWELIHTIVFDFDGVFTDNKVWVDHNGIESVRCDRGDGLGFDLLRSFIKVNNWHLHYFILSKEKNPVVSTRAKKIQVDCVQSVSNKPSYLRKYLTDNNLTSDGLIYLGNDLNDLLAMQIAGFSVAPSDAHILIKRQANLVLMQKGGEGFVRAFVEKLLGVEKMSIDEVSQFF